ncbi:hypothetical protein RFI_38371, partial [Reticulomyxa filosa]
HLEAEQKQISMREELKMKQARQFFGEEYVAKYKKKSSSIAIMANSKHMAQRDLQYKKHIINATFMYKLRENIQKGIEEENIGQSPSFQTISLFTLFFLENKQKNANHINGTKPATKKVPLKTIRKRLQDMKKHWKAIKTTANCMSAMLDIPESSAVNFHRNTITTVSKYLAKQRSTTLSGSVQPLHPSLNQ